MALLVVIIIVGVVGFVVACLRRPDADRANLYQSYVTYFQLREQERNKRR